MEEFVLGTPALVCRWRLSDGRLPLENRHLRALGAREVNGKPVSTALVAWVKQHVEWTLADGSRSHPDGTLMLVVDERGRAAMSVGRYAPLARTTVNDLLRRARASEREATKTGVSPEDLWVVRNDSLVWGTSTERMPSGAASLIADLARTLGMPVVCDEELLLEVAHKGVGRHEVFLTSDEHGVVPASDREGSRAQKFAASYLKLLKSDMRRKGGTAR